jgi:hypothetical protein
MGLFCCDARFARYECMNVVDNDLHMYYLCTLLIHLSVRMSVRRGLNFGFQVLKVEVLKPRSGPGFFFSTLFWRAAQG